MRMSASALHLLCLLSGCLMACGSTVGRVPAGSQIKGLGADSGVEGPAGQRLTPDEILKAFGEGDIFVVGERHADPVSVASHLHVLGLVQASGRSMTIGVEWLPESAAPAIAEYLECKISESEFLETSGWNTVWGFPFSVYAPIFHWAREHQVIIRGLNAPPGLARRLGREGLDGISEDDRASLTSLDSADAGHKAYFARRMAEVAAAHGGGGHGGHHGGSGAWEVGSPLLERYYLAQLLRDEHMARSAAGLWTAGEVVVVLAGLGHVEYGLGIPMRLQDLGARILVVEPLQGGGPHCGGPADYPVRRCDLRVGRPQ